MAVLAVPFVFDMSASAPTAVFESELLDKSAPAPTAVLKLPVLLVNSVKAPSPLFSVPLVRL
jgi:precorrin isomerase